MPHPDMPSERRAEPARTPEPTPEVARIRATEQLYKQDREREQRRSLLRGLLWLLLAVMVFSIARAGLQQVFLHGWWRP
jgi:fatty acid desaturase